MVVGAGWVSGWGVRGGGGGWVAGGEGDGGGKQTIESLRQKRHEIFADIFRRYYGDGRERVHKERWGKGLPTPREV